MRLDTALCDNDDDEDERNVGAGRWCILVFLYGPAMK